MHGRKAIFIPVFIVGGLALLSAVVMLLWNALMPQIFNLPEIGFWQALGLFILSKLLFGGLPHKHKHHPHISHKRWDSLSEEEKEKMREQWKKYYCCSTDEE